MGARAQTKDSRKRGSQRRYHRAEFPVNREQDLLLPKPLIAPPTNEIQKKKKSLLTCTKEKNRTSNGRKQEGMKGKEGKREGDNVILTVKKHARSSPGRENKTKNPRTPTLPLPLKPNESKREKKKQTEKKFKHI